MIEVQQLSKKYSTRWALQGVTFSFPKDHGIMGLLGRNGAGKTTLLQILAGTLLPDGGNTTIFQCELPGDAMEVRRRTGYMPEHVSLYEDMTPRSYLRYRGRLKGQYGSQLKGALNDVIEACSLENVASKLIGKLSRGNQQRVGLAEAVLGEPDLLLLDEPTQGMDPAQVKSARNLLRTLSEDTLIVLSSHIVPEVQELSERVLILKRGRIVDDLQKEEWQSNSKGLDPLFHHHLRRN